MLKYDMHSSWVEHHGTLPMQSFSVQVFLESTWRDVKVNTTSSSTATERLDVVDNFVQTTSRGTIGTQTDDHTKSAGGKVKTTGISDFLKR
jgi:hypothetical protein